MDRTPVMQEIRKMRFEETWNEWKKGRLTQEDAGRILGMSERTFRQYVRRLEERGDEGLLDKRLAQASARRAPVDEQLALVEKYRKRHDGWNVKHFHFWYKREGGTRSYTWVKTTLQRAERSKRLLAKGSIERDGNERLGKECSFIRTPAGMTACFSSRREDWPFFPGPESLWRRSSASTTNGSSATTPACLSRDGSFRSRPTATGSIMSGPRSGSTGIPTDHSPCFTDPGSFPTILSKSRNSKKLKRNDPRLFTEHNLNNLNPASSNVPWDL